MSQFIQRCTFIFLSITLCSLGIHGQPWHEIRFRNVVKQELGLAQNALIRGFAQDGLGFIWLATGKGLYRYDGRTLQGYYPVEGDPTSVSDTEIMSLATDQSGRLWIGTALHGVDMFDPVTGKFDRLVAFPDTLGRIWSILCAPDGTSWFGGDYGLIAASSEANVFQIFKPKIVQEGNSRITIRGIAQDSTDPGVLWLGTHLGVMRFNKETGTFSPVQMPFEWGKSVTDCITHSSGSIWCSMYYDGIISHDPSTGQWQKKDLPVSLKGRVGGRYNLVTSIVSPDSTMLWFAAFDGVGILDLARNEISLFPQSADNPSMLYPSSSYGRLFISKTRNIFIGGSDILSIAYTPDEKRQLGFAPVIAQLNTGTQIIPGDSSIMHKKQITLSDQSNEISIALTIPEYIEPEKVQFRYMLEGLDDAWITSGTGRFARYTNLGKGTYTFRYQASLDGEKWVDGNSPLQVVKKVSFWKSPWVFLIAVALLGVVFWLYNTMRIRRIREDARFQTAFDKKLAEVEMTALRAQMNPHFIFNALSSVKYFILDNDIETANSYLTKFSRLIRMVLRNSKSMLIPLSDELKGLDLYIDLEALRFTQKFEHIVEVDKNLDPADILIPPLLIQPYVENAIWHGLLPKKAPGRLAVRIHKARDLLRIEIEDDGIGREHAKTLRSKIGEKKSLGMHITHDRIALIKQTMDIDSTVAIEDLYSNGRPAGTRVRLEIPVIRNRNARESLD